MEKKAHIAIVEIGGSHDECILSQLIALKNIDCYLTLVTTKEILERNNQFHNFIDAFHLIKFPQTAIGDFNTMRRLNKYFRTNKITKVILNTAQGGHIRNLCWTSSKSTEFIGIIHTLKKFQGSFTQKLINKKIKKYLVLNDYFLDQIIPEKGQQIESFYPLRFPHFVKELDKKKDEIWITIIGGVESRRKDLNGSLELIKTTHDDCKFIFLGKSDPQKNEVQRLEDWIKEEKLTEKIKLFHIFIPEEDFDAYLKKTDFIWPMVHPNTPSSDEYFKNQISGAMNVSFAYKIPMLVHEDYIASWKDLKCSAPYSLETFGTSLLNAIKIKETLVSCVEKEEKFNPVFQEEKYLRFVLS